MSVKNFIPDDGSLWSIRAVDISGNYGQRLLFDTSGNAIVRTGNTDRLTIGNTGAWNVQGGMSYNNVSNTLTATTFSGALSGNATSATNLAGGAGGQIPYQSAVNTTALLANGTAGQVLTSQGTTLAPTWAYIFAPTAVITYSSAIGIANNVNYFAGLTQITGLGVTQTNTASMVATANVITVPLTGYYNVCGRLQLSNPAPAAYPTAAIAVLTFNDTTANAIARSESSSPSASGLGSTYIEANKIVLLAAGQQISLRGYQNYNSTPPYPQTQAFTSLMVSFLST